MAALSKPTLGGTDYAARIGLLFDAVNNGNYQFPSTQVPSADANTLDDYEEGTWTPVLTFATAGNLSVAYSTQIGTYTKVGERVFIDFNVTTSTFTHTTASGNCRVTGLPFTVEALDTGFIGGLWWQGITKANYTQVVNHPIVANTYMEFKASGSGQSISSIAFGDMPTAGSVILKGQSSYTV